MSLKTIARNKKAYFDYFVEKEFEAGIALKGSEVKSIRRGDVNVEEAVIHITAAGNANLVNARVKEFKQANIQNHDPYRSRQLLLKKRELEELGKSVAQRGYTIKPLSIYIKGHLIKCKIGLCKGKRKHDKRETLKEKDTRRDMDRVMKSFNK